MDRFLIGFADNNSGLQTDLKSWLIFDNAFSNISNAYVYEGRVRKRFGSTLMGDSQLESRLRINIGTTDPATGNFSATVPGTVFQTGQMFSVGADTFTVYQAGNPAATLTTDVGATGTYSTTTGAVVLTAASLNTAVWFYPATSVMGLSLYYTPATNSYTSIGFDTQFSYQFDNINNNWERLALGQATWTGSNSNFFWMINYQGATANTNLFWASNYNAADGIRYFDGTTWFKPVLNWTRGDIIDTTDGAGNAAGIVPAASGFIGQVFTIGNTYFTVVIANGALQVSAGGTGTGTFNTATGAYTFAGAFATTSVYYTGLNYIQTAKIIVQFKNRMVLLNTVELINNVSTTFVTRMRYSAIGSPLASPAFMQESTPGHGGALDAPTIQPIVTAQLLKDRLIVYFESSTFELVYTGNQEQPFTWQKINTELGASSTFSQIPFDKFVLGIDDTGIHACNGSNVDRIDQKIPNLVWSFDTETAGDTDRVAGVRDYYLEMAYWTFPTSDRNSSFPYPNKLLTYNYKNQSWALNDDSFTTFGYYLLQTGAPSATWGSTTTPWGINTALWNALADTTTSIKSRKIIAGNQQGFVGIINSNVTENAAMTQIDNMVQFGIAGAGEFTVTSRNHNLSLGDFIQLHDMNGLTFTDNNGDVVPTPIGFVKSDTVNNLTSNVFQLILSDSSFKAYTVTGTYEGGGTFSRVSQIDIVTKQYNFYTPDDRNISIPRIDFLVDKTEAGQIRIDYFASSTNISLVTDGLITGGLPGNNLLDTKAYDANLAPLEQFQDRLWHPVYFFSDGMSIQFKFFLSTLEMLTYVTTTDPVTSITTYEFIALQDFQLHAMVIHAQPTSYRLQ